MGCIEFILLFSLLVWLCGCFVKPSKRGRWFIYIPLVILLVTIIHLLFEGWRWQIIPAYIVVIASCIIFLKSTINVQRPEKQRRRAIVYLGIIQGLILVGLSMGLGYLLPVFHLPVPTGPFPVGTILMSFQDQTRPELLSDDKGDKRELPVRFWYPAEKPKSTKYLDLYSKSYITDMACLTGLPSFIYSHWIKIKTHSYPDAPVTDSPKQFPLLIYLHGYPTDMSASIVQIEELASHGYIVASIGHSYESAGLMFPDGRSVSITKNGELGPHIQKIMTEWGNEDSAMIRVNRASTIVEKKSLMREYLNRIPQTNLSFQTWLADTRFIFNEINRLHSGDISSILNGRFDIARTGIFGYSFGGAVAGQFCRDEDRCLAAVNLDCVPQYGTLLDSPLLKPLMMIYSDREKSGANEVIYNQPGCNTHTLRMTGTTHADLSVMSLYGPFMKMAGVSKTNDGTRTMQVINHYLLAFFDHYLNGYNQELLDKFPSPFPGVEYSIYGSK